MFFNKLESFNSRIHTTTLNHLSKQYFNTYLETIKNTKWNLQKWKGLTLMKDPMNLTIYQQLLQDKKFKTIVEFGTYEGGSALWMEDINKAIDNPCVIYTIDNNKNNVKLPINSQIIYKNLDLMFVDKLEFLKTVEHPLLIIEDAHVNLINLLNYVDNFLLPNDYLVVEDTIDDIKYEQFKMFIQDKLYLVDTTYCDMWGYNNSYILNSILKKM